MTFPLLSVTHKEVTFMVICELVRFLHSKIILNSMCCDCGGLLTSKSYQGHDLNPQALHQRTRLVGLVSDRSFSLGKQTSSSASFT